MCFVLGIDLAPECGRAIIGDNCGCLALLLFDSEFSVIHMKPGRFRIAVALVLLSLSFAYWMVRARTFSASTVNLRKAMLALRSERFELARQQLKPLLWFVPDHPEALRIVGLTYLGQKNYAEAIRCLSAVQNTSKVYRLAQLELVAALLADYRMDDAETGLQCYTLRFGHEFAATMQLFGLLMTQLRSEAASDLLKNCTSDERFETFTIDQQLEVLTKLATADFDPLSPDRSIPHLLQSFERHSGQSHVALALGVCYRKTGQLDRSGHFLERALSLSANSVEAQLAKAELMLELSLPDQAENLLNSLGSSDQIASRYDYFYLRSRVLDRLGQIDDSLDFARKALKLKSNFRECHSHIARILQKCGEVERAVYHHTHAHDLAKAELSIWNTARTLPETAAPEECIRLSEMYGATGRMTQAAAWRNVSQRLSSATEAGHVPASTMSVLTF
jgi:tetratricopeptide (TPR) repeat protein